MANVSSFSGAFPVIPGGMVELGYSAITTPGTVTSTTAGTGTEIIAPLTVACDGSPIMVEFYSPAVQAPVSGSVSGTVNLSLFQDGSENIRFWGQQNSEAFSGQQNPVHLQARLTPTAGTHSFGVKGYLNATGTAVVSAGNGSSTGTAPSFLRVSKIVQQNDGLKPFWNPPTVTQLPTRANTGDQVIRLNNNVYEPHQYIDSATGWKYLGNSTIICTSSTRPASPFEGQTIYETDTDLSYTYNGSAWVQTGNVGSWTSYTPTWTNLTVGNGTQTSAYVNYGKLYVVRIGFEFGSTSSISASPDFTLPNNVSVNSAYPAAYPFGMGNMRDVSASGGYLASIIRGGSADKMSFRTQTAGGTYVTNGNLDSTTPFTWASGDLLMCQFMFEAA